MQGTHPQIGTRGLRDFELQLKRSNTEHANARTIENGRQIYHLSHEYSNTIQFKQQGGYLQLDNNRGHS